MIFQRTVERRMSCNPGTTLLQDRADVGDNNIRIRQRYGFSVDDRIEASARSRRAGYLSLSFEFQVKYGRGLARATVEGELFSQGLSWG